MDINIALSPSISLLRLEGDKPIKPRADKGIGETMKAEKSAVVPKMVKTTIDMPEQMWKDFSVKVIQKYGGRKKNDVIQELIKKYLDEES